jgi:type I site-specific restriction endonuclease
VSAGFLHRAPSCGQLAVDLLDEGRIRGHRVAGGDRIGKTIIFAKNNEHAKFIAKRFDANYPHYRGDFARIITHRVERAQGLIDTFSLPDRQPHIAISVDMLDTGIDVPDVVNLVFFKIAEGSLSPSLTERIQGEGRAGQPASTR